MSEPADRFPYPPNAVIAVVAGDDDPDRYVRPLAEAGFEGEETVGVLHGEADAESLDIEGERHGVKGRIVRTLQRATDDFNLIRGHADALRRGDYVIAVTVDDHEQAHRVGALLKERGATSPRFFAKGSVESL